MEIPDLSGLELSEKEQKIIHAAIQVFSEKGFSAATTSEIAKNAGIAEGTIFRYFKTKKDILRGILVHAINLISGKLVVESIEKILINSGQKDLRTTLKEILYDRLKLADSFFPMARVIMTEALFHEDVREAVYQNIVVRALDVFRAFHGKMVERGLVRADVEPDVMFRSCLGNMAILLAQRKLFGDISSVDDIDKEFEKMIDVVMYGIATPGT